MINTTVNLYKNAYSGLNRPMWLLSLVMFINRSGTMVLPFMTLYCHHLGYTEAQGGYAVAVYGVGALFGAFIGGRLSDKFGFYPLQFATLFFGGIMFIILGQMDSFLSICVCIFFTSMVGEAFRPANSSAIAHYSTVQNRTQSFSLNRLAINLGWGIGSALAGILASISYHLLFWVDGFTNIIAAILLIILLPKVTIAQQHQTHKTESDTSSSPFKDKVFMVFLIFMLLFALCFFQLFTTVPLYFKEGLHLDEFWIGVIMSMNGIIIALFEMVIVFKLEGRRPYLQLIMYGAILMSISFVLLNLPLANGFIIAIVSTIMVTIAEMTGMPFMNSFYISRTTVSNRGRYAALYTMAWSAAQIIGSLSGTQIAHRFSFYDLWWVLAAIGLFTAMGFYWIQQKMILPK